MSVSKYQGVKFTWYLNSSASKFESFYIFISLIKAFWLRKRFWITASFEMSIWIFGFGDCHFKLFISCELNQRKNEGNDRYCQNDASNKNKNSVASCLTKYSQQLFTTLAFFFVVYFSNFWIRFTYWNFNNFVHLVNFKLIYLNFCDFYIKLYTSSFA